jgi:uncharacterized membrane protein YcaP (DUF421 family)
MSCPFAKYSEIFGKPNTGFHSVRIYDIAINDLLGTIALSGLLSYILNYNFIILFIILLILGIFLHRIFCVNTTINKVIFGNII